MLTSLTLPTLMLLSGIPGLPGLPGWLPHLTLRHPKAPPADTLPPPWKSVSRLTLDSSLVRGGLPLVPPPPGLLRLSLDPRTLRITVDPDSGTITTAPQVGEFDLGPAARASLSGYAGLSAAETFRRQWALRSLQSLDTLSVSTSVPPGRPGSNSISPRRSPPRSRLCSG